MTIAGLREKNKARREALKRFLVGRYEAVPKDVLYIAVFVLSCLGSFGLGMLVERDLGQGSAFTVTEVPLEEYAAARRAAAPGETVAPAALPGQGGEVVASRNGTRYYYPWCSGASRLSAATKISFASAEEAEAAGYERGAGCE